MKWAELCKVLVEIVAVIVAGWWAYSRFFAGEAPSLEERGKTESSLSWVFDNDRCTALFGVSVKNIGKRAFDITKIDVRVWLVPVSEGKNEIYLLDPFEIMKKEATFTRELSPDTFISHYPPDGEWHEDFAFSIPRDQMGHPQTALFAFDAAAVGSDHHALKSHLYQYKWSRNCDVSSPRQ